MSKPPIPTAQTELPRGAYLTLFVLMMVAIVSALDKSIMGIVQHSIQQEFNLSDSRVGFLTGMAFALGHLGGAIPFGRLADRVNRRNLVAVSLVFWSSATAWCGLASGFAQLAAGRALVGVGEAAGQAAQLTLVSDTFPPAKRATATALYYLGGPLGGMTAMIGGGFIVAHYGWRTAFYAAAIPGLILAALMLLVREPARGASDGVATTGPRPGFRAVVGFILRERALLHMMAAVTILTFTVTGFGFWVPTFFIREHGLSVQQIGLVMGLSAGVCGLLSTASSGFIADWLGAKDARWRIWFIALIVSAQLPFLFATFTAPGNIALAAFVIQALGAYIWFGPGTSITQGLTPPAMRSTVASVIYTAQGLIGVGLGPQVVGWLSDAYLPIAGPDRSLGWSLATLTLFNAWAVVHLLLAARNMRRASVPQ